MDIWVVALLAVVAGAVLGMLGGGGSMLVTPLLVYVAGWPAGEAIPASLATVGLTAAAGAWQHGRRGGVRLREGLSWAAASAVGAVAGGRLAGLLSGRVLMTAFAAAMAIAALAMLRRGGEEKPKRARVAIVVLAAVATGVFTGLVGAGGGFAVVPGLVLLAGLPMREAVGTSLLVIAVQSAAGLAGHLSHASLDAANVLIVSGGAVAGSFLGARLAGRLSAPKLKAGFALLLVAMVVLVVGREWGLVPGAVAAASMAALALKVRGSAASPALGRPAESTG